MPVTTTTPTSTTTTTTTISRCPHVVLMTDRLPFVVEQHHQKQQQTDNNEEDDSHIKKCTECGSHKHLWACLRADCSFVGCGRDTGGHSKQHAVRMLHPLAVNLATRNVWCEMCDTRVYLDRNDPRPPIVFVPTNANNPTVSRALMRLSKSPSYITTNQKIIKSQQQQQQQQFDECDPSLDEAVQEIDAADDFDLINYLDQENGRGKMSSFRCFYKRILKSKARLGKKKVSRDFILNLVALKGQDLEVRVTILLGNLELRMIY